MCVLAVLLHTLSCRFAAHLPSGLNWISLIVRELHLYFNPLVLGDVEVWLIFSCRS